MCGIAGLSGEIKQPITEMLKNVLVHRGPDDSGRSNKTSACIQNRQIATPAQTSPNPTRSDSQYSTGRFFPTAAASNRRWAGEHNADASVFRDQTVRR